MAEDINVLLERLNFSEEEWIRVISSNVKSSKIQGYEAWAVEKIMSGEKVNKNAVYRVLNSLWFTKEDVNFVELKEGVILVKFGVIEDRMRILNLPPWLFDQCLFAMLPYVKDQDLDTYALNISPFWLRIFNIPLEYMDKQVGIDVGKAIGEVVAIDWRDNDGKWTKYIRVRVKIDVLKPLRKVVHLVRNDGIEIVRAIKYERLPAFCYIFGLINHTTQKGDKKEEQNEQNLQYESWLRASVRGPTQARSNWRNGIEVIEEKKAMEKESNNDKQGEENGSTILKEKESQKC
ncbi:hypothetical protein Gotri_019286 [Gossypium trilobum]|uniref:DUF4283 domain-containing protein n=1 Tax=Gossypium trilobum TaxID=34281 RepID=A0A7J9ECB4_9ROSI|nr:hypothetical protein [Gossypium trilobum]